MKKIINLLALVLIAVSVIACSNPSDSIGYYPTAVQPASQETNNGGQETPSTNGGNQENPNNGGNQNGGENQNGQEQQNENPNGGNQGQPSNGGQETPTNTIIKFTKAGSYEFYLDCDSIEFPSEGYYVNVTYKGTTYKVENFKYDSNDIQSMSTTGYDKTSQRFYFKFSNISEENAFITNEVSVTRLGIGFNRKFVNPNAYVGIDSSNGTLIINSGN